MEAMRIFFRFIWAVWAMVATLVTLIIVTPIYSVIFLFWGQKGAPMAHKLSSNWAWILLTLLLLRIKVHNIEKLDPRQTYIFVSNHTSQLDIPAFALATNHFFKFLAKEELTRIPLLGFIIKHLYLTVDRKNMKARAKSMETMKEALANGTSVVIFPEGSRNRTDKPLMRFFDGAFQLAVQSGYPLAVMTIRNSGKLLPAGSLFQMSPGTIHCYWEGTINTEGLSFEDIPGLKEKTKSWMESRLANE